MSEILGVLFKYLVALLGSLLLAASLTVTQAPAAEKVAPTTTG